MLGVILGSFVINYFYDIEFVKIIIGIGRRIDNVQIRYPILVDFFMIIYSKPSINPSKAAISVINIERFIDWVLLQE